MLTVVFNKFRAAWQRRRYFLGKLVRPTVPPHSVSWLPDGFTVRRLARTGLSVVENFCTPDEAAAVIEAARDKLKRSGIVVDGKVQDSEGRVSDTALLYGGRRREKSVYPLMQRAAMLAGVPYTHIEGVFVTRYPEGGLYNEHLDHGDSYRVDRLYTVLLYLNTVPEEQGGATVFPKLNVCVQPKVGRAVTWTNMNPDGSGHHENSHTAMPVTNDGEKWVIQFWLRAYPVIPPANDLDVLQTRTGEALRAGDELPAGVSLPDAAQ